eukprot:GGOE01019318.1.p1 GENE.GGOE01019318.1~~GGOE01019318.1.p1  ORF type:complete len:155 (-),score=18.66 GGOE01019318.1:478-942(-)
MRTGAWQRVWLNNSSITIYETMKDGEPRPEDRMYDPGRFHVHTRSGRIDEVASSGELGCGGDASQWANATQELNWHTLRSKLIGLSVSEAQQWMHEQEILKNDSLVTIFEETVDGMPQAENRMLEPGRFYVSTWGGTIDHVYPLGQLGCNSQYV